MEKKKNAGCKGKNRRRRRPLAYYQKTMSCLKKKKNYTQSVFSKGYVTKLVIIK